MSGLEFGLEKWTCRRKLQCIGETKNVLNFLKASTTENTTANNQRRCSFLLQVLSVLYACRKMESLYELWADLPTIISAFQQRILLTLLMNILRVKHIRKGVT